jgi:hypothetical protein
MECNCSHCSRKGFLLTFVPRADLRVKSGEHDLSTNTFNKHRIRHRFRPACGCAPFAEGKAPDSAETATINIRCLAACELLTLNIVSVDGRSF